MEHQLVGDLFLGALVLLSLYLHFKERRSRGRVAPAAPSPPQLYVLASQLYRRYEESARPADLLQYAEFEEGVRLLNTGPYSVHDLLAYYSGDNPILACMATEALARRAPTPELRDDVVSAISSVAPWTRYFALRVLAAHVPTTEPIVGPLLLRLEGWWMGRIGFQFLRDFIAARVEAGEVPTFGDGLARMSEPQSEFLQALCAQVGPALVGALITELIEWERTRVDTSFLASIGKVWGEAEVTGEDAVIEHDALQHAVRTLEAGFKTTSPRSILLIGESGVGKTAIVRVLANRLQAAGWVIFEAGQNEVVAGQVYIGQIEERLRKLVHEIGGKRRVLWFVPEFHRLLWAGRHLHSETSALDFLLPYIEQGEIVVLGETQPAAFERLTLVKPRCATALVTARVEPLADAATLDLARAWVRRHTRDGERPLLLEATLREAGQLSLQYLGDQAAPGRLLKFLDLTRKRLQTEAAGAIEIRIDDLIATLTQLTGLPVSILDDRHNLNLAALRELFDKRVLGQPEAVACLVERVAMIKAGVTDPARPQGVFLFAGPTGTGKTEIAKTLAEFLFGSANRMIRLDMSELQTADSLVRLLGTAEGKTDGALVDAIRKQPFSVVLLDEFEKAHPNVWDLFLQVFDDGRLTDRAGNTADFRHAILIMTSNLGGVTPIGTSLGFAGDSRAFRPQEVERAIAQAFRPEFLNRIDRVVVFHPLTRDTMREILYRELDEITSRRGLRNRSWAVEWEDDAIEFLLTKGFSTDRGARPLKRAIERYLLSPLALTIVNHQYPMGDQFLFVKAEGDGLAVQFVDPGASTEPAETVAAPSVPEPAVAGAPESLALERIAFDPRGSAREIRHLEQHFERLRGCVEHADWQDRKQELLARMANRDFWHSPERFRDLGEAEYMDRIERGLRGAGSLLLRLKGSGPGSREHYPRDPVERLAEQLFLLDNACAGVRERQPRDAFLLVEAGRDPRTGKAASNAFARRIGGMYRAWATKRRMVLEIIEEAERNARGLYHLVIAVSGYGAYRILRLEEGIHVLELPRGSDDLSNRCKSRVRVVPQPDEPAGRDADALRRQAAAAFRTAGPAQLVVVRRYRELPAPLVRDRVRGWRSGKFDRILGGDFDLIAHDA